MTIMTPTSPSINAAHNVSVSTLRIIRQELCRASNLMQ
jgi:poly(A) polymerase Pap1